MKYFLAFALKYLSGNLGFNQKILRSLHLLYNIFGFVLFYSEISLSFLLWNTFPNIFLDRFARTYSNHIIGFLLIETHCFDFNKHVKMYTYSNSV